MSCNRSIRSDLSGPEDPRPIGQSQDGRSHPSGAIAIASADLADHYYHQPQVPGAPEKSTGWINLKADVDSKHLDKVPIAVVAYVSIDIVVNRSDGGLSVRIIVAATTVTNTARK